MNYEMYGKKYTLTNIHLIISSYLVNRIPRIGCLNKCCENSIFLKIQGFYVYFSRRLFCLRVNQKWCFLLKYSLCISLYLAKSDIIRCSFHKIEEQQKNGCCSRLLLVNNQLYGMHHPIYPHIMTNDFTCINMHRPVWTYRVTHRERVTHLSKNILQLLFRM